MIALVSWKWFDPLLRIYAYAANINFSANILCLHPSRGLRTSNHWQQGFPQNSLDFRHSTRPCGVVNRPEVKQIRIIYVLRLYFFFSGWDLSLYNRVDHPEKRPRAKNILTRQRCNEDKQPRLEVILLKSHNCVQRCVLLSGCPTAGLCGCCLWLQLGVCSFKQVMGLLPSVYCQFKNLASDGSESIFFRTILSKRDFNCYIIYYIVHMESIWLKAAQCELLERVRNGWKGNAAATLFSWPGRVPPYHNSKTLVTM